MPKSVVATWLFAYIPEKKYVMTFVLALNKLPSYLTLNSDRYLQIISDKDMKHREVFSRLAKNMLQVRN
jgi:hypothetical protein